MAEALKVLGQLAPANITLNDLYTVPALTAATISSLIVCNRTTSQTTFRIAVQTAAEAASATADKHYIFYDQELDPNSTFAITIGLTLNAGDVVRVRSSVSGSISYNIFGIEVS